MAEGNLIDQVVLWLERQKAQGRRRVWLSAASRRLLRSPPPAALCPAKGGGGGGPAAVAVAPREAAVPARPAAVAAARSVPVAVPAPAPAAAVPGPAPADLSAPDLAALAQVVAGCTRCRLHAAGRRQTVFGEGAPRARLMFVGEGPGEEEDAQGRPFVGAAGQLLTKMVEAMHLRREEVYIANIVKCRPPANRPPEPDEGAACLPYVVRQIELVQPACLVLLGATPYLHLLGKKGIMKGRGTWEAFRGIPVMPTYHPAFLLRVPARKREVWADLQAVMRRLGL
ncbi:MAG: uracil-DNA glycosylase [Lentisphaeria bacterium]